MPEINDLLNFDWPLDNTTCKYLKAVYIKFECQMSDKLSNFRSSDSSFKVSVICKCQDMYLVLTKLDVHMSVKIFM